MSRFFTRRERVAPKVQAPYTPKFTGQRTLDEPIRLGEDMPTPKAKTPKYYKASNELEIGKSYSEIRDEKRGILRKTMKKPKSLGKLDKILFMSKKDVKKKLDSVTFENRIAQGVTAIPSTDDIFRFVFTKLEAGTKKAPESTEIEVPFKDLGKKRFILNCPKGGYGTRRAASKVRRHTRRRLPSK